MRPDPSHKLWRVRPVINREQYEAFAVAKGATNPVEVIEGDGKRTLVGYAVVWGAVSSVRADGYRHQYMRGSIEWEPTVNALWAHSLAHPIGSTANGTLRITEDEIGARVEIDLPLTTVGNDTLENVRTRL